MILIIKLLSRGIIIVAVLLIAKALYLPTKAMAAQILLEMAWHNTQQSGQATKPWPWADTSPLARLAFPDHQASFIVLSGSQGSTLAFAPGHMNGSALPNQRGHMVISGHRDSHFAVLQHLAAGDVITIEDMSGELKQYRVQTRRLVDSRDEALYLDHSSDQLTLITCYPFDAIQSGGPLRLRFDATPIQHFAYTAGQRNF